MIFHTLNEEIDKKRFNIKIQNIEGARGHWGSDSKQILKYAEEIDLYLYDKENFDKQFLISSINLFAGNYRLKELSFYKEDDTTIMFVVSERKAFKETLPFSRKIDFNFKSGFKLSIVELTEREYFQLSKKEISIPESWIADKDLTDKFIKYNTLFG